MTIATNLPVVYNSPESAAFPSAFERTVNISDETYDELLGLLEKRTRNTQSARNLAAAVIQGLVQQDIDINEVIDSLRTSSDNEIDLLLAVFLNNGRVGTSYLGVANQFLTNPYVSRTVLP